MQSMGERITELRKSKGLTMDELSKVIGIPLGVIMEIERGISDPTCHTLKLIAKHLNVTTDYLLGLSEDKRPNKLNDIADMCRFNSLEMQIEAVKEDTEAVQVSLEERLTAVEKIALGQTQAVAEKLDALEDGVLTIKRRTEDTQENFEERLTVTEQQISNINGILTLVGEALKCR